MLSDADDLMNKDSLIRLLADLKSEKSDVVLGGVDAIWDTGKPSERADYIKRLIAEYPKNKTSILFSWVGPIGKAIRKQLIVENGLKFESRLASNDVVFAARLASLRPTLSVIERNLYTIIQSGSSLTANLTVEKAKAGLEATWIRNQINASCRSGLKLHYGITFYKFIAIHGSFTDALKYLPGELKSIMSCCYWNLKRFFVAR